MAKLDRHGPRLIRCARLVRATGMDELPQLFNLLRGEMGLVGPRPCTPNECDAYSAVQRNRTRVLPGLTGLWQANGKNNTIFSKMIELDLHNLRTHCLWLDMGILLRTPVAVAQQVVEAALARKQKTPFPVTSSGRSPAGDAATTMINKPGSSSGCRPSLELFDRGDASKFL
jgi:exopolysaccharide production protein ExoY